MAITLTKKDAAVIVEQPAPAKKTAAKAKAKPVVELSAMAELIDEIGTLQKQIEKANEKIEAKAQKEVEARSKLMEKLTPKLADLRTALDQLHDEDDADKAFTELGEKFEAVVSKKGNLRKIKEQTEIEPAGGGEKVTVPGVQLLKDLMTEEVFFKCAKVDLKNIDAYLTPEEKELVLETSRTPRTVTVKPREK